MRVVNNCLNITLLLSILFISVTWQDLSFSASISPITAPVAASATNNLTMFFSTYLGGSEGLDHGRSIAVGADSSYYVLGQTVSDDFPTQNAFDDSINGHRDVFISKFDRDNSLLWSTFFGGSDLEVPGDIAVTDDGSCYIIGTTKSTNFPIKNAYQNTFGGGYKDIFVAKFSSGGLLLWSTYFGGSAGFENGFGIAVSDDGSCYVTGETQSSDFPTKKAFAGAYNGGNFDTFVAKFSSNGKLQWSTYLGGAQNDIGNAVAIAHDGSCYITGRTWSNDFPTKNAFDATHNGYWDVFVTKFSSRGKLRWSTYIGGDDWDEGLGIDIARDGSCYITGFARSTNFPTKQAYNSTKGGLGDAFVSRLDANGLLLWSTFLGGNSNDRAYDVAAVVDCSCYVIGETYSTNFPTPNAFDNSNNDGWDAFVSRFAANGSLLWGSYLGGSEGGDYGYGVASSDDGKCYVVGTTHSDDFPIQNATDSTLGSTSDAFIAVFIDPFPPIPYIVPPNYSYTFYGLLAFFGISFFVVVIAYTRKK